MIAALIIIAAAIALIGGTWALLRWDDRRGDPGDGDREAATFRKIAHEIAHEEYLPAPLAACPAVRPEDRAVTQGWPRSDAPDHRDPGWPVNGVPTDTLAPALPDAAPGGPSAGARAPEGSWSDPYISGYCADGDHGACMPDGPSECPCDCHGWQDEDYEREQVTKTPPEPPAGDEAPGPAGAPEGDGQAARPPQGTAGPGDLLNVSGAPMVAGEIPARPPLVSAHETAAPEMPAPSPLATARAAMDAVARLEPGEYLAHLDAATGYGDDGPFINWLSHETQARGFPPIKAEVA